MSAIYTKRDGRRSKPVSLYKGWCARPIGPRTGANVSDACREGGRPPGDRGGPGLDDALALHRLEPVANEMKRLGYAAAARILSAELSKPAMARSGDLGETLATELVEEMIGLRVPVRRLRYKE